MKNYDEIFDQDIKTEFFYNNPEYTGKKLVVGSISLANAIERLNDYDEYYTLVTYMDGEKLPEEYVNVGSKVANDGMLFATVNPSLNMQKICNNGGIQNISRLPGNFYLLGPGPDEVNLDELVKEQIDEYNSLENEETIVK